MTLGDIVEEFLRQVSEGKSPRLLIKPHLIQPLAELLKREGFAVGQDVLQKVKNPAHREALETLLLSTTAFAITGAAVGGHIAGPKGAAIGAGIGAGIGFAAGAMVVFIDLEPDPTRGGYVLSVQPS